MRTTIRPKREPKKVAAAPSPVYGLMAQFDGPESLLHAAEKAAEAGYTRMDGYSPFPIEELAETMGKKVNWYPWCIFVGGLTGLATAFFMIYYATVLDYPMVIQGRPYFNWQTSVPIFFELSILLAAFTTVGGLLIGSRLPELYHPVFNVPQFERASQDSFFLCIESRDPQFDRRLTQQFLEGLHPLNIAEVSQ